MLILKLTLVPLSLLLLGIIERRHGPRIAGWLSGFPVIAGPLLFFLARDHGAAFAGATALAAYFGLIAWLGFVLTYVQCARHWAWHYCAVAGFGTWGLAAILVSLAQTQSYWLMALPFVAIALAIRLNPRAVLNDQEHEHVWWGLPARMLAGFVLTLFIANFSVLMGSRWSGLFTTFPVLGSIIAISSHVEYGREALEQAVSGMMSGLLSVAVFCFCSFLLLARMDMTYAFAIAVGASMATHGITGLASTRLTTSRAVS